MKFKVHGGTARLGDEPLCLSCRYAAIATGVSANQQVIQCSRLETQITFRVVSCTRYLHASHPSLYDMEDLAWVLRTDRTTKQVGFVRAKDLKSEDRHILNDDSWD